MGLGHSKLWATNVGDESGKIYLTAWIPEKRDGKYFWPDNTPIGGDMWVNNCLGLTEEEGTVCVDVVRSDKETGIWIICYDADFMAEQHLENFKPRFKKDGKTYDYTYQRELAERNHIHVDIFGLHVNTFIEMETGDGPWPVTLVRTTSEEIDRRFEERRKKWFSETKEEKTSKLQNAIRKLFK